MTVLQDGEAVEQAPITRRVRQPATPLHARTAAGASARRRFRSPARRRRGAGAAGGRRTRCAVPRDDAGRQVDHACGEELVVSRSGAAATLGLVGESGSGKSTVAAALTGLVKPDAGTATFGQADVFGVRGAAEKALRRRISLVFQDPFSSLNPRAGWAAAIDEPLRVHGLCGGQARAPGAGRPSCSNSSDCHTSFASRYPHELSGGRASAREHRPCTCRRARAADPRRSDCVAGCFGAGPCPRPARELQRDLD